MADSKFGECESCFLSTLVGWTLIKIKVLVLCFNIPSTTKYAYSVSSSLQLLSNVLLWNGIVQEDTVRDLGLSKLLNRYLLLNLLNTPPGPDNIGKCNKVRLFHMRTGLA